VVAAMIQTTLTAVMGGIVMVCETLQRSSVALVCATPSESLTESEKSGRLLHGGGQARNDVLAMVVVSWRWNCSVCV
jgi:hypothetical protein